MLSWNLFAVRKAMKKTLTSAFPILLLLGCTGNEGGVDTMTQDQEIEAIARTAQILPGVWELISYTVTSADGEVRLPFGDDPRGQIIYTETGEMSAQLMNPDFDFPTLSEMDGSSALDELGVSAFFAYWGTYTVDEAQGTVTHHLEGSLYPDWVGVDQVRNFRLEGKDRLVLWAQLEGVGEPGDRYELVWSRVR